MLIGDDGSHPTECKFEDLFDGMNKKILYVKTWTGRTVSLVTDPNHADVEALKRQLRLQRPGNPEGIISISRAEGKVLKDSGTTQIGIWSSRSERLIEMTGTATGVE